MGLTRVIAAVFVGVIVGLLFTIRTLDGGVGLVVAGPWKGSLRDGTPDVDPYTLAANERSSILPLGTAEGLTFVARADGTGAPFLPSCTYVLKGPMPAARFWTVSLLDPDGFPLANPAERYGFTSAEVLRDADARVTITISKEARSGNWLPIGNARAYLLMLRLYDTGLSTIGTTFEAAAMPKIERLGCG